MKQMNLFNLLKPKNLITFFFLVLFSLVSFFYNIWLGITQLLIVVVIFLFQQVFNMNRNRKINEYLEDLFLSSDSITKDFVVNSVLPLAIVKEESTLIWYNNLFSDLFFQDRTEETSIRELIKGFPALKQEEGNTVDFTLSAREKIYHVIGTRLTVSGSKPKYYSMLYFIDVTKMAALEKELSEKQMVHARIVLDNYDESINGLSEANRAVLIAETDKHIFNWAQDANAVIKKLEKDHYILFFEKKHLKEYLSKGFEKLRDLTGNQEQAGPHLTLSIGIGYGGKNPIENDEFSSASIDMALGRGGDQVVVKDPTGFSFYGGTSKEVEKRTKVRSRVIALALKELIESKDHVVIMGHQHPDMDLIGSALGLYRGVKTLNKKCYILLDEINPSIRAIANKVEAVEEYEGVLINKYQAESLLHQNGVLILVDTHRKMLLAYPELLDMADTVVLIDHHRKSMDFIENSTLTYHEPYASSTSELIIEILQYMEEKIRLNGIECQALYAGMLVDTKNFTFKTGVRTFEAASFLRRSGLDPTEAKELVKCDLKTYQVRNRIVNDAVVYRENIAISSYEGEEIKDPSLIAQAADELINIKGITTTFVLYLDSGVCKISARSVGNINVQVIMEKLGGGGHQLAAGAQVNNSDLKEVQQLLIQCIDEYLEKQTGRNDVK